MRKTEIFCDGCGKAIKSEELSNVQNVYPDAMFIHKKPVDGGEPIYRDLCVDCANEIQNYIDNVLCDTNT